MLRAAVGRLARAEGLTADGLTLVLRLLDGPAPAAATSVATRGALARAGLLTAAGPDAVALTPDGRALGVATLAFLRTLLAEAARRQGRTLADLRARARSGGAR